MGRTISTMEGFLRVVSATPPSDEDDPILSNNLMYTKFTAADDITEDNTSKNVGDLNINNAEPIAFNHLTGHFTEALTTTADGGADQTASWGGTPVVRPAVINPANTMLITVDYTTLNGMNADIITEPLSPDGRPSGRKGRRWYGG